jgi:hypothetical protein
MGVAWIIPWLALVYDSPDTHPCISRFERIEIVTALSGENSKDRVTRVPWRQILTSLPLWANVAANCSFQWGTVMMQNFMPTFFQEVHHLPIDHVRVPRVRPPSTPSPGTSRPSPARFFLEPTPDHCLGVTFRTASGP